MQLGPPSSIHRRSLFQFHRGTLAWHSFPESQSEKKRTREETVIKEKRVASKVNARNATSRRDEEINMRPRFKMELEQFVPRFLPHFQPVYFPESLLCVINSPRSRISAIRSDWPRSSPRSSAFPLFSYALFSGFFFIAKSPTRFFNPGHGAR